MEKETTETKKMTIARALKEKARLKRRLTKARELFMRINCIRPDEDREADAGEVYEQIKTLQAQYVALKKAIAVANAEISPTLVEMITIRAELAYYTNLRCMGSEVVNEWKHDDEDRGGPERVKIVYNTFLNEKARSEILEELTTRLDNLQDEVDQYNVTHFVEMGA